MAAAAGKLTLKDGTILPYQVLACPPEAKGATPLVMVQGLSGSKENWFNLPAELARHRPVLIFDNRGIGQRPVPQGPYSTELMASDCVALADHLGWKKFHLFGISMGGAISQTLALNYPERVVKLVLGCTSPCFVAMENQEGASTLVPPPHKLTKEEAAQFMRNSVEINLTQEQVTQHPELVDQFLELENRLRKPAQGIAHQFMSLSTFDARDRLRNLQHETLIISGSKDRLIFYPESVLLNELIPNSTLRIIPNVGHLFYAPDPKPTANLVNTFLADAPKSKL